MDIFDEKQLDKSLSKSSEVKQVSFMDDLFNMGEVTDSSFNRQYDKTIFVENEKKIALVGPQGNVLKDVGWSKKPATLSYVFLRHSAEKERLYTILGDCVEGSKCDRIIAVLNFWCVYLNGKDMYISHITPEGQKFKYTDTMKIEDYGLLAINGMVVKIDGEWKPYRYMMGLYVDSQPQSSKEVTQNRLLPLLFAGFSYNYLTDLCEQNGIIPNITIKDEVIQWEKSNRKSVEILKSITTIASHYTTKELRNALNLTAVLVAVFKIYTNTKDITVLI